MTYIVSGGTLNPRLLTHSLSIYLFNEKFQAISGCISETVKDRAKVSINH